MRIGFGYELVYTCSQPVPMILMLHSHPSRIPDLIRPDRMVTEPDVPLNMYVDGFGNTCTRIVAPAGGIRLTADGLIEDSGLPDPIFPNAQEHPIEARERRQIARAQAQKRVSRGSRILWKSIGKDMECPIPVILGGVDEALLRNMQPALQTVGGRPPSEPLRPGTLPQAAMAGGGLHPYAGRQVIRAIDRSPSNGRALDSRAEDLVTLLREERDQSPEMLRSEPPGLIPHGIASSRTAE